MGGGMILRKAYAIKLQERKYIDKILKMYNIEELLENKELLKYYEDCKKRGKIYYKIDEINENPKEEFLLWLVIKSININLNVHFHYFVNGIDGITIYNEINHKAEGFGNYSGCYSPENVFNALIVNGESSRFYEVMIYNDELTEEMEKIEKKIDDFLDNVYIDCKQIWDSTPHWHWMTFWECS